MPLEFDSISHGKIAFGFFNIDTDLILLNHYFFFADDFCRSIGSIPESPENEIIRSAWEIYLIEHGPDIGNLMGAIHGIDHRGFIGEVYKHFPFPEKKEDFKQKTDGSKNRSLIEGLIQKYARRTSISFVIDRKEDRIAMGEFVFDRTSFQKLIHYVWLGGFPRWKDDLRPDYVLSMKEKIESSKHFLFEGLRLD
jgi:hypothetical protein